MVYLIEQKITPLANQYRVFNADRSGNKAELLAFVQQKRFAFKEQVDFYSDEAKSQVIFSVKAEKVMDIHGNFIVTSYEGQQIGAIRKKFGSSLLRSTWEILHNGDIYLTVQERSVALAIMRRLWSFVPIIGDLPFFFKFHFDFLLGNPPQVVANYNKLTLLRDHYKLEVINDELLRTVGWQTLIAQAILLDALQGR